MVSFRPAPRQSPGGMNSGCRSGPMKVASRSSTGHTRGRVCPSGLGGARRPWWEVYLTTVADALETGGAVGAWHAYLTLDGALWWSLGGETELNGEPLRPAAGL